MRMTMLLLACAALAQERPSIGWTLGRDGGLRRLDGVAGAFRTGAAEREGVTQFYFDGREGWQVRGRTLERFAGGAQWELDEGPVVLFASGAYQPRTGALYADAGVERHAHLATGESVLAAEAAEGVLTRIVARGEGVWLERVAIADGAMLEARRLGEARGPVVVARGEILAAPADLEISELFAIGEGWFQARTEERSYALRRRAERWEVFEIPGEDAP